MDNLSIPTGPTPTAIIEAAYRLFINQGYHGTSMRQIATEAGIAVGGIYNHFNSKEDIFLAVFMRYHPIFDVLPAMSQAQGDTLEQLVRSAATRMVAMVEKRMDFIHLFFIEMVEFKGVHLPQMFSKTFPTMLEFSRRLTDDRPELRPIPQPVLVRAFVGLFFSYIMTELLIGKQMPASMQENSLDYFIDIFLHGVINPTFDTETNQANRKSSSLTLEE
jgi:AcrR family transcriptional regulator